MSWYSTFLIRRSTQHLLSRFKSLHATRTCKMSTLRSCKYFLPIQTRWSDNDQYGHVNNTVYYQMMDTIINNYLIWYCGLTTDSTRSSEIGFMVKTNFQYRRALKYPETVLGGLRVIKIGRSSVTYQFHIFQTKENNEKHDVLVDPFAPIGFKGRVFSGDDSDLASRYLSLEQNFLSTSSAVGQAVHVFVDPQSQKPKQLSPVLRNGLEKLVVSTDSCSNL